MSKRATQTVRVADLADERGWSPLRLHLDVRSFGINGSTAREAGGALIPEHDEVPSRHEELYVVTTGPSGTVVFVPDPAVRRAAVAREAGTTVLAIGGVPGEAYRPRAWETNFEVLDLFDRGDHAGAKRVLTEALARYDDHDLLHYNLACAEAQLGESDAALDHLEEALRERPSFAEDARDDPDLASLRELRRFAELVGEA